LNFWALKNCKKRVLIRCLQVRNDLFRIFLIVSAIGKAVAINSQFFSEGTVDQHASDQDAKENQFARTTPLFEKRINFYPT